MWQRSYRVNKTNDRTSSESCGDSPVKGLPHKHRDPNSMPETHIKSWVQNLRAGEEGEEDPWRLTVTQSSQISELLAQRETQ